MKPQRSILLTVTLVHYANERVTEEEEFTPPWTLQGLRAEERKKRLEKEAEHERIRQSGGGLVWRLVK